MLAGVIRFGIRVDPVWRSVPSRREAQAGASPGAREGAPGRTIAALGWRAFGPARARCGLRWRRRARGVQVLTLSIERESAAGCARAHSDLDSTAPAWLGLARAPNSARRLGRGPRRPGPESDIGVARQPRSARSGQGPQLGGLPERRRAGHAWPRGGAPPLRTDAPEVADLQRQVRGEPRASVAQASSGPKPATSCSGPPEPGPRPSGYQVRRWTCALKARTVLRFVGLPQERVAVPILDASVSSYSERPTRGTLNGRVRVGRIEPWDERDIPIRAGVPPRCLRMPRVRRVTGKYERRRRCDLRGCVGGVR